jgi:hypothetical protein
VSASALKRQAEATAFRFKSATIYTQIAEADEKDKNARMLMTYSLALLAEAQVEGNEIEAAERVLARADAIQRATDTESAKMLYHRAAALLIPSVSAVIEATRAAEIGVLTTAGRKRCTRARDFFAQARAKQAALQDLFLDQAADPIADVKKRLQVCASVVDLPK